MRTITWGAIGWGDVCERKSGPPLYQVDGCRLRGITRRDAAAGRDCARRHAGCTYFPDVATLLADPAIEAVYVATHPDSHMDYTLQAAAAGKHVLVEKEMALDAGQCTRMIAACREAGVVLGVAFYRRCYPSMLRVKALLTEDAIGPLRELRINDQFPLSHRLDLAHFLCGEMATISATFEDLPPTSNAPQGPVLHARALDGAQAIMNVGWHESTLIEKLTLTGERGSIEVHDLKAGKLSVIRDGERTSLNQPDLPFTHWGLVDNFSRHLRGDAPLACPGEEGRKSQVIEDLVAMLEPDGSERAVVYD